MDLDRLRELLDRWEEDALSAAEADELAGLLQTHAAARSEAVSHFLLTSQLRETLRRIQPGGQPPPAVCDPALPSRSDSTGATPGLRPRNETAGRSERRILRSRRWWLRAAGGLAAAVLLVVGGYLAHRLQDGQPQARQGEATEVPSAKHAEAESEGVAVVTRSVRAEWEAGAAPFPAGATVPPGWLKLKSGLIQLEFYSGATVVLEGSASLEVLDTNRAHCAHGKLWARVPSHARGFTILSDTAELVDLGTEFGMQVAPGGATEVQVFAGKVEVYEAASAAPERFKTELTAGNGVRVDEQGKQTPIPGQAQGFTTAADLQREAALAAARRYQRWQSASEKLATDPRLIVYYRFQNQDPWDRTLRAGRAEGEALDGAIVGCEWTTGRWPGKPALEFKRPGDRVRLNVPGKYRSLTFLTWVRLDGLDREFTGLLLSDEFHQGNMHWQITQKGCLYLGLKVKEVPGTIDALGSPPFLEPGNLGQWFHLASVYDSEARMFKHYVNGREVAARELGYEPVPILLGSVEIGNWGIPSRGNKVPVRNLNGRMDEFLLFHQALGAQEIETLYQAGKPDD
jgi:hypothetical protein